MELKKFEVVNVEELLNKIGEKIIRTNQDYLQMDIETFKEAAARDKPTYFLWLAHPGGTWCLDERETYIKGTAANYIWNSFIGTEKPIEAVAITIYALSDNKVIGDIYELNHKDHCREIKEKNFQAISVEIHSFDNKKLNKICIPMNKYKVEDYWKPSVKKINYTVEKERNMMQTIAWIRKHRKQTAIKGLENEYLNEIEKRAFTKYLWYHDKKKTSKHIQEIKLEQYKHLEEQGYIFITLKEAEIAKEMRIPFEGIDREGKIIRIYREPDIYNFWEEGGYLCMEKEWKRLLNCFQTKPKLLYTENQLMAVCKKAQSSYNESSEIKKRTLGKLIAKVKVILHNYENVKDRLIFKQEIEKNIIDLTGQQLQSIIPKSIEYYLQPDNNKNLEETVFSREENKAILELLAFDKEKELQNEKVAETLYFSR